MHEVLVNRLGGLSLPRKSVVRLTDRPDMTLDVYRGRKTTMQQQQQVFNIFSRTNGLMALRLVVRRYCVHYQCRGVLLIWIIAGQWPFALAVGVGEGCLDIFTLVHFFSPLSPSLWETA